MVNFLEKRRDVLEGVVISGGEPTIQERLPEFAKKIKEMGYSLKLDTNGSRPQVLRKMIEEELLDFVSLDIKGPREKYGQITGEMRAFILVDESLRLLKSSNVDLELRTTLVPGLVEKKDVLEIVKWIEPAQRYTIQNFRPGKTIDPKLAQARPFSEEYLCLLYTSPSPRDLSTSRMPSSA